MPRRNAGEGSLYQRKDGSWCAQFQGQYRYAKDKDTAKAKLYAMLTATEQAQPKNITIGKVLDDYLAAAKQNLKPRTVKRYREAIADLKPALGNTKMHALEAAQIEEMYARKLRHGTSPSSIRLLNAVLSNALKRAARLKLTTHNVCKDVELPRIEREEVEIFSPQEVQALLSAASQDRLEAAWVISLTCGLRVSELTGLQVQDYDASKGTLAIRRSVYNGAVGSPKSKRGRRTITLPQLAQDALTHHIQEHEPAMWMFPNSVGNSMFYSTFLEWHWRPLLKRAGVQYKNPHTCRHTVASTLLGKNLPIPAIARYLGHKEQMLLSTYSHLMPDQMDAVAAAMDDELG
jgi:integrase